MISIGMKLHYTENAILKFERNIREHNTVNIFEEKLIS